MARPDGRSALLAAIVALFVPAALAAQPGTARGTIDYRGNFGAVSVAPKFAYLVKGPDAVTGKTVRRIVLSPTDLEPVIRACATMICGDGDMDEGLTIDLDLGPRINYWFVASGQRVQYSGTAEPSSLQLTTDTAQRVAGRWSLDAGPAGNPQVRVEFDAALIKVFTRPH